LRLPQPGRRSTANATRDSINGTWSRPAFSSASSKKNRCQEGSYSRLDGDDSDSHCPTHWLSPPEGQPPDLIRENTWRLKLFGGSAARTRPLDSSKIVPKRSLGLRLTQGYDSPQQACSKVQDGWCPYQGVSRLIDSSRPLSFVPAGETSRVRYILAGISWSCSLWFENGMVRGRVSGGLVSRRALVGDHRRRSMLRLELLIG